MISPYYQDQSTTIYHGKCTDVLPQLDPFNLVVTSPPYNLSEGGRRVGGTHWSRLDGGYSTYDDGMPHEEYVKWQQLVIQMLWDGLTDTGAIYYNHKQICRDGEARLPFELVPNGVTIRQVITWDRGSGFSHCFWYYTPRVEWILLLAKQEFRLNTQEGFDLWKMTPEMNSDHPAPFPIQLPKKAIGTTDAQVVVDPFSGSGTTLVAAKSLGRKAIGIELDESYCELAVKRLAQGSLFEVTV